MAAEAKTKPTEASVDDYLAAVEPERRRADAKVVDAMMRRLTASTPRMWGPSIVGYGERHYRYESGRQGDWPLAAFAPRKANLVFYLTPGLEETALLERLGKHKSGKGCLYINRLADIDLKVLEQLVERSVAATKGKTAT